MSKGDGENRALIEFYPLMLQINQQFVQIEQLKTIVFNPVEILLNSEVEKTIC